MMRLHATGSQLHPKRRRTIQAAAFTNQRLQLFRKLSRHPSALLRQMPALCEVFVSCEWIISGCHGCVRNPPSTRLESSYRLDTPIGPLRACRCPKLSAKRRTEPPKTPTFPKPAEWRTFRHPVPFRALRLRYNLPRAMRQKTPPSLPKFASRPEIVPRVVPPPPALSRSVRTTLPLVHRYGLLHFDRWQNSETCRDLPASGQVPTTQKPHVGYDDTASCGVDRRPARPKPH